MRRQSQDVYIAAVGLTKVDLTGKVFGSVFDLFLDAYQRAVGDSPIRSFDAIQVGIMDAEEFENRANIAAKIADRLGLVGVPAVRSETASSTGAAAFHEAYHRIASGEADNVLVIAGERMKNVTTREATAIMSKTVDPAERRFGFTMPALIALVTQMFFAEQKIRGPEVADILARLMNRAHAFGAENPLAAFSGRPEPLEAYFDEERNLPVATPLRRKDCSPICDGAAAVILTARPQAVQVAGLGSATDTSSLLDRAELGCLAATRRAAEFACWRAGIRDLRSVDGLVVEAHDAFNSLLPISLVDLGILAPDEALDALVGKGRGDAGPIDAFANPETGPRGRIPVNLSGGLKARGHPVGGTGLFQIAELYLQLTGRFPNPRAQVRNAEVGVAHSIGGPGNNVFVTLLESHRRRREPLRDLLPPPRQLPVADARRLPPSALHGRRARIEAATTIHVTAGQPGPIHVALLSVGGRRVFARLENPAEEGADVATALAGKPARFLIHEDGDHYVELGRDRWDVTSLVRNVLGRFLGRRVEG
ncbi:MAG: beta-ketoacyl synthase N-terminal-like domain-containing protein [Myxococcota bacterium]